MGIAADVGQGIGDAISSIGAYSGRAASQANAVSAAAQSAQGTYNAGQAALGNSIAQGRIGEQYSFNAAQAMMANQFTESMWDKAAAWNEMMWQRNADWNHNEALLARQWQQMMENTKYQRAIKDMEKAGLNPILAVTNGGISVGSGGGGAASSSAPSMSGATGAQASGGLLQGLSASESSYTGQMEYLSGTLGLISAAIAGISSATKNLGSLGDLGRELGNGIADIFKQKNSNKLEEWIKDKKNEGFKNWIDKGNDPDNYPFF